MGPLGGPCDATAVLPHSTNFLLEENCWLFVHNFVLNNNILTKVSLIIDKGMAPITGKPCRDNMGEHFMFGLHQLQNFFLVGQHTAAATLGYWSSRAERNCEVAANQI